MKITKRFRTILIAVAVLSLALATGVSQLVFRYHISDLLVKLSIKHIFEVQDLYTQTLKDKVFDQFAMLEAQARYFDGVNLDDVESLKKVIMATKGIGDFKKIAVANKDGTCINYTGQGLSNIYNKSFFRKTMATGGPQISDRIELDENLDPILSLTYPIYPLGGAKQPKALLLGTLAYNMLSGIFSVSMFSGVSYNYIIADDGNIIFCNRDKKKTLYNVNFYDFVNGNSLRKNEEVQEMKLDVINKKSGFLTHYGKDEKKIVTYAPLGLNDWYIISVVPFSYVLQQQSAISTLVLILLAVVSVILVSFLVIVYTLFRHSTDIEKDNERLTIASNQTQSLIFEYDIPRQTVEFSGDTQFLLGTEKKEFSVDFIRTEYFKRIHEDDKKVIQHLRDVIAQKYEDFTAEFRYKIFNNEFIWLRMTGSLILEKDDKPKAFIGSINNVNAQVMHEQELKSIAEVDRLTGLLNKSAMEMYAKKYLEKDESEKSCALFIIDLDNFKKVNDTLGHLVGDSAILDAAKKLSLIFSEKDFISRFGGDEFCILMRLNAGFDLDMMKRIIKEKAENICMLLKEDYFDDTNCVSVSASVGIAVYPAAGKNYEDLFKSADAVLYDVKQSGKNGFRIAGE